MASIERREKRKRLLALAALLCGAPNHKAEPVRPGMSLKKPLLNLEEKKTKNLLI